MTKPEHDKRPLPEKLRDWLEGAGYPLELRTAAAFGRHGFTVAQARYYQDPVTARFREIDVRALCSREYADPDVGAVVSVVVECKRSRQPWVLLTRTVDEPWLPSRRVHALVNASAIALFGHLATASGAEELKAFAAPQRHAFGITTGLRGQAGGRRSGRDPSYSAVMTATKAGTAEFARLTEAAAARVGTLSRQVRPLAAIVLPVVVLEGRLFECGLDADGALDVREVDRGALLWWHRGAVEFPTFVDVVTVGALDAYVGTLARTVDTLLGAALGAAPQIAYAWQTFGPGRRFPGDPELWPL